MTDKTRRVTISVSAGRNISLNFQTWQFTSSFTEEVSVDSDEALSKERRKLRLRAVAAVYSDILHDFDLILKTIPDHKEDALNQAELIRKEAETAISSLANEIKELA